MTEFKTQHEMSCARFVKTYSANFGAAGTQSNAVFVDGQAPIRFLIPGTWASTATDIRITVSDDNVTYYPLWTTSNTAYTIPGNAGKAEQLGINTFVGGNYVRLHSTTVRGTAVPQTVSCTVKIIAKLI